MIVCLPASVYAALVAVARDASPREACGFLLGRCSNDRILAEELAPTLNTAVLPGSFAIPDVEIRRVTHRAARAQLTLTAVYHSHPSGELTLSVTDARALHRSRYPWLIIGSSTSAIAAYSPDGARLALELD